MNANGMMMRKPPRAPPSSATSTPKRMEQQRSSEARNDAVSIVHKIFFPIIRLGVEKRSIYLD